MQCLRGQSLQHFRLLIRHFAPPAHKTSQVPDESTGNHVSPLDHIHIMTVRLKRFCFSARLLDVATSSRRAGIYLVYISTKATASVPSDFQRRHLQNCLCEILFTEKAYQQLPLRDLLNGDYTCNFDLRNALYGGCIRDVFMIAVGHKNLIFLQDCWDGACIWSCIIVASNDGKCLGEGVWRWRTRQKSCITRCLSPTRCFLIDKESMTFKIFFVLLCDRLLSRILLTDQCSLNI